LLLPFSLVVGPHRLRVVLPLYPITFSIFHTAFLFSAAPLLHAFLFLFYDLTVANLAVAVDDDFTLSLFGLLNSLFGSYLYFLFIALFVSCSIYFGLCSASFSCHPSLLSFSL